MRERKTGAALVTLLVSSAMLFGFFAYADEAPAPRPSAKEAVKAGPVSPPTIDGPATAKRQATFAVTNLPTGAAVLWDVSPAEDVESSEKECDGSIVIAGKPAAYTLKARVVRWDAAAKTIRTTTLSKTFTLTGGDPAPVPPPPVPPGPTPVPPGPTPTPAKVVRFVVVEDTSKPGTWRGDLLGSPKVVTFVKALKSGSGQTGPVHAIYSSTAPAGSLGAEGTKYVGLAAGKTLPYIWLLDHAGAGVKDGPLPKTPDEFVAFFDTHANQPRAFGLVEAPPKLSWNKFGATANVPLIPRAQWKPITLNAYLPPPHDQDGIGQCASSSSCALLEASRTQAGLPYVYLSAGDLYGRREVSGGQDNGSTLEDNMNELLYNGVAPVDQSHPYVWNGRLQPSGTSAVRSSYRFSEVYLCPTFEAAVSAIQQGFMVEIGMTWCNNFTPAQNGWLPRRGVGVAGGHALYSYGVAVAADGTVGLVTRNSWSASWGGSADGTVDAGSCIIPESLITGSISGFYAVRAVQRTDPVVRLFGAFRPECIEYALAR